NRIGARFARRIAVTFPDGGGHFPPGKVVVTGNPLRPELRGGSPDDAVRRFGLDTVLPLVYVPGGAPGAQRINRAIGALLPPLPGTSGDEQTLNARLVERAGGAVVLPQAELTPERLLADLRALLGEPRRLKDMGARAVALAVPDAAARLVSLLIEVWR